MSAEQVSEKAEKISALLRDRLGAKGEDLAALLAHKGARLPKRVRRAAETLAQDAQMAAHPKLQHQIDLRGAAAAFKICQNHLEPMHAAARRSDFFARFAALVGLIIVLTAAGLWAFYRWHKG